MLKLLMEKNGQQRLDGRVLDLEWRRTIDLKSTVYCVYMFVCLFVAHQHYLRRHTWNSVRWSQAARQGLAVLMASALVVLKHETSTLRQRHNFTSIDLQFGVGDYDREANNPDKVGSGPMSGRDAKWGQYIRVLWLFFVFIFFNKATAIPMNQFSCTKAQKKRSGVRKTLLEWEMCNSEIWGCFTQKIGRNRQLPA